MRKVLLALVGLIMCAVACKSSGAEEKMYSGNVDAQVEKLLAGKEVYADATRIIPVLVNPKAGSGDKKENLEGYAIVKKGAILTDEQAARLQSIIFNKDTYNFDLVKKCVFRPYVGFIFEKEGKQSHALFCFACNEVAFGREGKQGNLEDFDAALKDVAKLSLEAFPTDATLKKVTGK